tara:strand:- start:113 stop:1267 length:1155 start_codon:yes stop_codon:yes gene_type:complete
MPESSGYSRAGELLKDGKMDLHQALMQAIPKEVHGLPDPLAPQEPAQTEQAPQNFWVSDPDAVDRQNREQFVAMLEEQGVPLTPKHKWYLKYGGGKEGSSQAEANKAHDLAMKNINREYWDKGATHRGLIDLLLQGEGRLGWKANEEDASLGRWHPKKGTNPVTNKPEDHPTVGYGHYQDTAAKQAEWKEIFGDEGMSEDFARRYLIGDIVKKKSDAQRIFDKTAKRLKLKGRWKDVSESWLKNIFTDKLFVGTANAEKDSGWQALVKGALEKDATKRAQLIMTGAQQRGSRGWRNRAKLRRQKLVPKDILDLFRPNTLAYDEPWVKAAHDRKIKVKKGETLSGIGRKWGVKWQDIVKWNSIEDPDKVTIGQELTIKVPAWKAK